MNKSILIITSLLLCINCYCQSIQESFNEYQLSLETEKVYASLDKTYYIPQDIIWGKIYVVDGRTHQLINEEPIIHLDWIDPDGKILKSHQLKIKNGVAAFDIETFLDSKIGSYTIRAFSQYQLNFDPEYLFQREVKLINRAEYLQKQKDSIDEYTMHFFPEGGHLVEGLQNSLAYKIESENGQAVNVVGKIIDKDGNVVCALKTWKEGMGRLEVTPKKNQSYWAEILLNGQEKRFKLPSSLRTGYVIKAHTTSDDKIYIDIKSNTEDGLKAVKLLAHIRGQLISYYDLREGHQALISLEKTKIPSGIVHLTLFDHKNRPVAERLVFNKNKNDKIEIDIKMEDSVATESDVSGSVSISGNNEIVKSTSSLSIYNVDILSEEIRGLDIENYLLLQSDLKGKISDISQYFLKDDNITRANLDLLLMTHAWRRFSWQSVLDHDYFEPSIPKAESTIIAGKILKKDSNKSIKADVGLNILNEGMFAALQQTTEEDGFFFFPEMHLPDTTDILLQAVKHSPKKARKLKEGELKLVGNNYVDIDLLDLSQLAYDSTLTHRNVTYEAQDFTSKNLDIQFNNRSKILDETDWNINLDEVVIQSRRYSNVAKNEAIKKRYKEKGIFFFSSTDKFLADDPQYDEFQYDDIHDMLAVLIPSAKRVVISGVPQIIIGSLSSGQTARIAVDGQLMTPGTEFAINPKNIYSADLIVGLRATALYDNSTVISLLSRGNNAFQKQTPGKTILKHPGYYTAREFYNPVYGERNNNPDYRTTVLWNNSLHLNSSESLLFHFRTSKLTGRHVVFIEGITENGIPFVSKKYFNVTD